MWSNEINQLAIEIAGALERGEYLEENFNKLCQELESDEPPHSFERFAVLIESEQWRFCDSELVDFWDAESEKITNELRCDYMREVLAGALEDPIEDTPSAHWEEISISPQKSLYCCALAHIEGYSPVTQWFGAYLSLNDFYLALNAAGYVTCEQDLALLEDEVLMRYWTFNETP